MLMNIYLDEVLLDENNELNRLKLQEFLIKSNSYRIQSVFHRINQYSQLKYEIALLHGQVCDIQHILISIKGEFLDE